ncbi:hypothetical protein CWB96_01770 [Pseudoalteromonas citrea]|uniref:Uncharacterized protein n=1 Tax=Pseudoalteromonas citrea TaxID=43655 RepID=A0A5S3XVZ8_9GAMM|nr:hypothetical protein [Pseudoalteromonas citrea]TMP46370.1 hypothetical protein CWB97_01805 [Pseudoalteromonas citrea]TMP62305.1 hypothetical protein CWB96_01770 [Pseudoalteromonas citrea]
MMSFLLSLDWMVVVSKLLALCTLLILSKHSLKAMLFGKPGLCIQEQIDHSLFVLVSLGALFHLLGRFVGDAILVADLGVIGKRQLYYFYFSLHELLLIVLVIKWHNIKRCDFAGITKCICYLSGVVLCLQLLRYVDRVIIEANYLESVYRYGLVSLNLIKASVFLYYPFHLALRYLPNRKYA